MSAGKQLSIGDEITKVEVITIKTIYKGMVSLRDFDVAKFINKRTTIEIKVPGQNGSMFLSPEQLIKPDYSPNEIYNCQYQEGRKYKLLYYKWNPEEFLTDIDKLRISLMGEEWWRRLRMEMDKPYMKHIAAEIAKRRTWTEVYPSKDSVFRAYKLTPFNQVNVVILGQDPYHDGSADGLAFSSRAHKMPPSIKKVKYTIEEQVYDGLYLNRELGELYEWAEQGVFLLNTILTVDKGQPLSHELLGWQTFTKATIQQLLKRDNIVYMLWGGKAKQYGHILDRQKNLVIECEHPAFACREERDWENEDCFNRCNLYLAKHNKKQIIW